MQVKFMVLRNAMVSSELSESGNFIRAFEVTKECFWDERRAFEEGRSALFQQYEVARLQIHEERQHLQAHCAAVDGENNGPRQRICQPEGPTQHMLDHAKSFQAVNGAPAAENGLLKAGRVQRATETRGASAQRSGPKTQLPQQCAGTVFHAHTTGEQQRPQEKTIL
ncbi:hypothetical protein TRVL_09597 [Trypanosoma vivax]|nr:hypothetical protein TRVL_09597 [Trypanosoma vivax]